MKASWYLEGMTSLAAFTPNTIPVPVAALRAGGAVAARTTLPEISRDDRFSKGKIVKYFPNLSYGFVRDHINRELFFHIDEIDLVGPKGHKQYIKIGAEIGYDCCRTSHGLRIKKMKIY